MRLTKVIPVLFWLALPLLFASCGEDGLFGSGGEEITPTGEECGRNIRPGCATGARCENGYCLCPDTSAQIGPGWCIPNYSDHMFVTYDVVDGILDTAIISFDEDPYEVDWSNINSAFYSLNGNYRIKNNALIIGSIGALLPPRNANNRTDSIDIVPLYHPADRFVREFEPGGWVCQKTFTGRFIDRDTIRGQMEYLFCRRDSITPKPPEAEVTYPMTWVRLKR